MEKSEISSNTEPQRMLASLKLKSRGRDKLGN